MAHGGKRKGAGRPRGSCGKRLNSVATKTMRVPITKINDIKNFLCADGYKIPLYSSRVPASTPSDADDHVDKKIDLNSLLLSHPKESFLLRVTGDSMIDAGIYDKDLIVVDRKVEAKNKDIIVACVDNQVTVKYFLRDRKGKITLMPANDKFKPIEVKPSNDFQILGVVAGAIKTFK